MVYTLKGWYDEIKGETDVAVLQRLKFIAYWKKAPFPHTTQCKTHVVLSTTNMVVPTTNHITRLWNGSVLILFILYGWGPKEEGNIPRVA